MLRANVLFVICFLQVSGYKRPFFVSPVVVAEHNPAVDTDSAGTNWVVVAVHSHNLENTGQARVHTDDLADN